MLTLAASPLDAAVARQRMDRGLYKLLVWEVNAAPTECLPWFGALGSRLVLTPTPTTQVMATDGTSLFYNVAAVASPSFTDANLTFVLAHEILHCGLLHMFRKPVWCDWHEWNVATDLSINAMLIAMKIGTPPTGILYQARFANNSAEEIARILAREKAAQQPQPQPSDDSNTDDGQSDDDSNDSQSDDDDSADSAESDDAASNDDDSQSDDNDAGDSNDDAGDAGDAGDDNSAEFEYVPGATTAPSTDYAYQPGDDLLPPAEPAAAAPDAPDPMTEQDWIEAVDSATAVSSKAGQMPGGLRTAIDATKHVETDWREILREFVENTQPSDYTWQRPARRTMSQDMYLPSLHKENMPPVLVFMDTSGSCQSPELLSAFGSQLTSILHECRPRYLAVVYADTGVQDGQIYLPDESAITLTAMGGGGTAFGPSFDWLSHEAVQSNTLPETPAAVIYLTDGYAYDLDTMEAPVGPDGQPIPVLWAILEGGDTNMPFGQVVTIDY